MLFNSKSTPSSQQKIRGAVAGDNKLEEDVTKKRREILESKSRWPKPQPRS